MNTKSTPAITVFNKTRHIKRVTHKRENVYNAVNTNNKLSSTLLTHIFGNFMRKDGVG